LFGASLSELAIILAIAAAVGALLIALLFPYISGDRAQSRVDNYAASGKDRNSKFSLRAKPEDQKDGRRKLIQDSLKQVEDAEKTKKKKKKSIASLIAQAGLSMSMTMFWVVSAGVGLVFAIAALIAGANLYVAPVAFIIGFLGLPRWVINHLANRRRMTFLNDFADAIDVMVRGLKSGLPVNETIKIISTEMRDPVGPEFVEVVDGQRIGITVDQGIERMAERVPLAEVNFLSIVMGIQAKTGGNLSEALSNLSRVLRDRKKMKAKIKAVSQEAKSSAFIIGALPFFMIGAIYLLSPDYIMLMFTTKIGNIMLVLSGIWMTIGMLVMKKMINFEI
jgi:tight adherence protein B